MKILIINDYNHPFGGVEAYLEELMKRINKKCKIKFYSHNEKSNLLFYFLKFFNFIDYFKIKKIINTFQPDIIHVYNIAREITPGFMFYAKKKKIPIVLSIRDYHYVCPKTYMLNKDNSIIVNHNSYFDCLFNHKPTKNIFYNSLKYFKVYIHKKIIKKKVDFFITPSDYLTRWIKKIFKTEKCLTLPNPSMLESSNKIVYSNRKFFLYVGRLSPEKGLITLLKSFKILLNNFPNEKLVICGDGPQKEELISLSNRLDLKKNIKFKGKTSRSELKKYYANAKCTLVPSEWMESYGNVVLESFVFGTPVIVSNIGGIKETILLSKGGLIFKMGDMADLTKKMEFVLQNPHKMFKLSLNGKKYSQKMNFNNHIHKLINIYRGILNDENSR